MFTPLELTGLRRDLLRWVSLIDGLLAAGSENFPPPTPNGQSSGPLLAELSILIRPHEAAMLTRLADEIPDLPEGLGEVDRMRAALRYCFHHVYGQTFEVQTTGTQASETTHRGKIPRPPKELAP